MELDRALPAWHRREHHSLAIAAEPAVVWSAVDALTWGEVPVFRALMRIRALGWGRLADDETVLRTFRAAGFAELARTSDELLFGGVARVCGPAPTVPPEDVATPTTFRGVDIPGHVKVAMNFRYADGQLRTETRVLGTDACARRRFAVYWFVIRPGSGLIRRIWLRAIRRRCDR